MWRVSVVLFVCVFAFSFESFAGEFWGSFFCNYEQSKNTEKIFYQNNSGRDVLITFFYDADIQPACRTQIFVKDMTTGEVPVDENGNVAYVGFRFGSATTVVLKDKQMIYGNAPHWLPPVEGSQSRLALLKKKYTYRISVE